MSIMINTKEIIAKRFRQIVEEICASPEHDYKIDRLAKNAGISKYHFHRLFSLFYGINIYEYVILKRLGIASVKLKNSDESITEIAFSSGYSSSQSFAKAFKNYFSQSPSEFRKAPNLQKYLMLNQKTNLVENLSMSDAKIPNIEIIEFKGINIAGLRHRGSPNALYETVEKFIAWRIKNHLPPQKYSTFNIFHNPLEQSEYDFEVGCEYNENTKFDEGFKEITIPALKCASLNYIGDPDDIGIPATQLYKWVIDNGYEPNDYPLFCRRVSFPPFVNPNEAEAILYLPIK